MGLVVGFAGRIGSGKSSVSEALAHTLGWRRTGFGDYLRDELTRRGGDPDLREALQDLGQSLVDTDPEGFCRTVLAAGGFAPGADLLVDGIRHVDIHRIIARLVPPSEPKLIFLAADDTRRIGRVGGRASGHADFARAETHRVEADLRASLPAIADVTIDAHEDFAKVVEACLAAIESWKARQA
jgi:hypothetical protein